MPKGIYERIQKNKTCLICGEKFKSYKRTKGMCRNCYEKKWSKENSEHLRKYNKLWHKEHPGYTKEHSKKWRRENPEHRLKEFKYTKKWRKENPGKFQKQLKREKEKYRKIRKKVFTHYGNKCVYCGETRMEYLQLDHVNNDGKAHRKEIGSGTAIYRWAIKNNYPDRLQILCHFCNLGKAIYGEGHKSEIQEWITRVIAKNSNQEETKNVEKSVEGN